MKKINIYAMLILAASFIGCTEDFNKDVAAPQSWDQEEAAPGMSFSATAVDAIDLNSIDSDSILFSTFTAPKMNDGVTLSKYDVLLDGKKTLAVSSEGKVNVSELQAAVEEIYGKRPEKRVMEGVVTAYVEKDGQVFRLPSETIEMAVTPKAPFIDSAYYLIGNMNDWNEDPATLIKLGHSDKDVYDDPIFSVAVEVPESCYWKVIPQKNIDAGKIYDDGVLGCAINGDTSEEGKLITENPGAMMIEDAGWVIITLNMLEYTYSIKPLDASPYMYVACEYQGWALATAPIVYSTDFINYRGFINLDGEFKLCSERSWDGTNYGAGAEEGKLSTDPTAGNLSVTAGLYYLNANINTLTWTADKIETMGVIGDATANGWDASTPMEYDKDKVEFTVVTTLKPGGFKFRANNDWAVNLGGTLSNLEFNSNDNIPFDGEEGTYKITLSLANADNWNATVVKQ